MLLRGKRDASVWRLGMGACRIAPRLRMGLAGFVVCLGAVGQVPFAPFLDSASDPAISPDGKTVVFAWWTTDESKWGLYTRPMNGGTPVLFANGRESIAVWPKWSPDGKRIAFLRWGSPRTGTLFVKSAAGGEEKNLGSVCVNTFAWTADSRSLITPNNGDTDSLEECRLMVISAETGEATGELAHRGNNPVVSPDGKMLTFVRDHEQRFLPLTVEGRANGPETTLGHESVLSPVWIPATNDLLYTLVHDRSVLRRVEARAGAIPRDVAVIDGEFLQLAFGPTGEPLLGEVYTHDDSFWRMDLSAVQPRFEKMRQLRWNVHNLTLSPDGQRLLYTVYTRGETVFYLSNVDGSGPRRLFSIPYERVSKLTWSPDGKQFAFIGEPYVAQVSPYHLMISPLGGPARRLLPQKERIYSVGWAPDGKGLLFTDDDADKTIKRFEIASGKVTVASPQHVGEILTVDGSFVYARQIPFNYVRLPLGGGAPEVVVPGAAILFVGHGEIFYMRRDGNDFIQLNPVTRGEKVVAKIPFGLEGFQVSPDGRFIYAERHEPPKRSVVVVRGVR